MKPELHATTDKRVFYIGKKRPKLDKTFRTNLRFYPGQSHLVISTIAEQMLQCRDVYAAEGSPELARFIEQNPLDAANYGLVTLTDEQIAEQKALEQARLAEEQAAAEKAKLDEAPIDAGDYASHHFEAVAKELNALVNLSELDEWVAKEGLEVELSGKRAEKEAQVLDAYKLKYPEGK